MSNPTYGLYVNIPSYVRHCKDIEPAAKLFYGDLVALSSNEQGYCWASNQYLAEINDVDERTIRRWIESLKEKEFIIVEIEKDGFQTKRKIWTSLDSQKFYTKGQKSPPEGTKTPGPADKNSRHINTSITTYDKEHSLKGSNHEPEKPMPIPKDQGLVFSKEWEHIQGLNLLDKEKSTLMKNYSPELVKRVVEYVTKQDFHIDTTLANVIFYYCKHPDHMQVKKEEKQEEEGVDETEKQMIRRNESEKYCKACPKTDKTPLCTFNYIEFRHSGIKLHFDNKDFKKLATENAKSYASYAKEYERRPQISNTSSQMDLDDLG